MSQKVVGRIREFGPTHMIKAVEVTRGDSTGFMRVHVADCGRGEIDPAMRGDGPPTCKDCLRRWWKEVKG